MKKRQHFRMRGNPSLLRKGIAIIGSSVATQAGIALAHQIGMQVAQSGNLHVSGRARGIDAAGHFGALRAGGKTLMVLPHGLDYQRHRRPGWLRGYEKGAESLYPFLEISQFADAAPFSGKRALERNQTVVNYAHVVIVIETAPYQKAKGRRSGTFQTALMAMKKRVPVFCVEPDVVNGGGNADVIAAGAIGVPKAVTEDILPFLRKQWRHRYVEETI